MNKNILIFSLMISLSGCAGKGWNTSNLKDEFTGSSSCRVERNSEAQRDFMRGFTGNYFTYHFFAEKRDNQIRAGIMSEPAIPIGGDVQIKVGEKLIILTSADTPIDVAPTTLDYSYSLETAKKLGYDLSDTMAKMTKSIQQIQSPYRVLTDKKALSLLKDMANTNEEIKFRIIGVNSALSATGVITTGPEFTKALNKCGINL